MLGKSLKKRLSKQNWIDATKNDKNPYQTWTRVRRQAESALLDLLTLANHLPNEKQDKIFAYENVYALVHSIINQPLWEKNHDKKDFRRAFLAAEIANDCISKCINQYKQIQSDEVTCQAIA